MLENTGNDFESTEKDAEVQEELSPEEKGLEEKIANEEQPKESWKKIFEAALFMSPNALSISDFLKIVGASDYTEVKKTVLSFLSEFNSRESALEILQIDDSFKMQVKPEFEPLVSGFAAQALFHPGLMKTLALIAFKQPILQSTVIKYRNNKAYDHISRLVDEGFIVRQQKGRSFVIRTTKKFFEYFGNDFKKRQGKS